MSQRCRTSSHFTKNSVSKICENIEDRINGDQRRTRLNASIFWSLGLIRKSFLSVAPSFGTTYFRSAASQSAELKTYKHKLGYVRRNPSLRNNLPLSKHQDRVECFRLL